MSYPGHSLREFYPSAEKHSVYSTAPADWANIFIFSIYIYIYIYIEREREREREKDDQYNSWPSTEEKSLLAGPEKEGFIYFLWILFYENWLVVEWEASYHRFRAGQDIRDWIESPDSRSLIIDSWIGLVGNKTRMLRVILNKPWKQHPTKQLLYGSLPPISNPSK